ncbi:glutamate-cysteine ligase [Sporosarcina newyorkensis 2681]|uniref:Glutamate-cysteine ligase n=1 Tax=Sporosarcina newyorkensis 2681 TaxID=1027292 RepID=F9DQL3_9BACL|nr:glutamate-cysteine ligase [Sporosarcina newyorkensis 2681]
MIWIKFVMKRKLLKLIPIEEVVDITSKLFEEPKPAAISEKLEIKNNTKSVDIIYNSLYILNRVLYGEHSNQRNPKHFTFLKERNRASCYFFYH